MPKKSPLRVDLPHLTPEQVAYRDHAEENLRRELSHCNRGDFFDDERADHVLRAAALKIFRLGMEAYSNRRGFESGWIEEIANVSIYRVLKNAKGYIPGDLSDLFNRLDKTISEFIEAAPPPSSLARIENPALTGKQAAGYARAGIALDKTSPLTMMAMAMAHVTDTDPSQAIRKRRIPRSIHSRSAAQKLEDFLNAKGITQTQFAIEIGVDQKTLYRFRRSGKVGKSVALAIARAMGTTMENLIAR